ncbi:DUF1365 domain-containing protein [Streptomyces sp. GZWMJZ-114]
MTARTRNTRTRTGASSSRSANSPAQAALYPCEVFHLRNRPVRQRVRHRTYLWYVDADRPPRLPRPLGPLARFDPRDHFGGTAPTLRAGLDRFLAAHGIDLRGGPVRLLANARVLGYVFNPLSLWWCHDPEGALVCVVAEVHNTYGERHAYLLGPERMSGGEDEFSVPKEFYVSPFFPVDGSYRMRLPEPGARLSLAVHLEREGARPFTATVRGHRVPARPATVLRASLRHPLSTLVVSAAIRAHGIRLYLRGLPVVRRPRHPLQEGMR